MNYSDTELYEFVKESNRIEGIEEVRTGEMVEAARFMEEEEIDVERLEHFVSVFQPGAELRRKPGLDVRVGNHIAPSGGYMIEAFLADNLMSVFERSPYENHQSYEALHPFTDGNGRSGRILWAWQMLRMEKHSPLGLGFLHAWYYQSLEANRK